jgi:hypothetical protein
VDARDPGKICPVVAPHCAPPIWSIPDHAIKKDAVDKTREKMAAYRDGGMEQVSQDIVGYTQSQPMTALLIATGVGVALG